ncbi:transposase [Peribacillus sp. TH27]|nr:transposase [Peribacillus sp. TH27]
MTAVLNNSGLLINRKAVQRHMMEMGIAGISPGPHLSKRKLEHRTYPYLLRNLPIAHPNHIWGIDILNFFIFDCPPKSLGNNVIQCTTPAIHTNSDFFI